MNRLQLGQITKAIESRFDRGLFGFDELDNLLSRLGIEDAREPTNQ